VYLVATTKPVFVSIKSSAIIVGLFCFLLLFGCQEKTPEEVTANFWQALAQSQLAIAKELATSNSKDLINLNDIDKHSPIKTGPVVVDDLNASVETTITRNNKPITFNTVLYRENDGWKVDFQQTHTNIAMVPFEGIAKSLQNIGESFTKQLEQTAPLIEKEMESLGNQLKQQIDEFGKALKKPENLNNPKTDGGSI
jgi:hypothetical protein